MVKKTIIAIAAVVLLVAVFVGAYNWGYTRYGAVYYYGEPFYMYYPLNSYPYYPYNGVYYPYNVPYVYPYEPGPLASDLLYRYGAPSVAYPAGVSRSREGQLCGIMDSTQFGCDYGLVCDYTKTSQKDIGVCSAQLNYPYLPSYQYSTYSYPSYSYPGTYAYGGNVSYYYGSPTLAYSTSQRNREGQFCGIVGGQMFGCDYGLVCDYTKTNQKDVGICSREYQRVVRAEGGTLCGLIDGEEYGCTSGLVCDYTKTSQRDIGVCSVQATYPYYG